MRETRRREGGRWSGCRGHERSVGCRQLDCPTQRAARGD